METVTALVVSFIAFTLICVSHERSRDKAVSYFSERALGRLRWLGYFLAFAGVTYLCIINIGDIGLIEWFGLHPVLILIVSLLSAVYFRGLVLLTMASPAVIGLVCLALLIQDT